MRHIKRFGTFLVVVFFISLSLTSCVESMSVKGNDNGSEPVNSKEALDYQKAVIRCLKTGGTRIVKIEGQLRCY